MSATRSTSVPETEANEKARAAPVAVKLRLAAKPPATRQFCQPIGGVVRCPQRLTLWSEYNSAARMQASPTLRTTEYGGLDTSKGCYTLA